MTYVPPKRRSGKGRLQFDWNTPLPQSGFWGSFQDMAIYKRDYEAFLAECEATRVLSEDQVKAIMK